MQPLEVARDAEEVIVGGKEVASCREGGMIREIREMKKPHITQSHLSYTSFIPFYEPHTHALLT